VRVDVEERAERDDVRVRRRERRQGGELVVAERGQVEVAGLPEERAELLDGRRHSPPSTFETPLESPPTTVFPRSSPSCARPSPSFFPSFSPPLAMPSPV